MSGVNAGEGVVISRTRTGNENLFPLDAANGRWFIVQTNYDRNVPDPKNDSRRLPAEHRLEEIG